MESTGGDGKDGAGGGDGDFVLSDLFSSVSSSSDDVSTIRMSAKLISHSASLSWS